VIRELARQYDWVRGIDLMRNYGQHNALLCGIRAAEYEIVVTMDDDMQHPPEEIPVLLDELRLGYDVVYGSPIEKKQGFWRRTASWAIRLALRIAMGVEIAFSVSSFRAFRTRLRKAFDQYESSFISIDVLLSWATDRFTSVPVNHDPRRGSFSGYSFRNLTAQAFNMLTGFSILPLQIASFLGFASLLLGFAILVYVLGAYMILGSSVPGFTFLASIITIFAGVQLFALGTLGEYVARIHFRTIDRPSYSVRSKTFES
jgi:undecaprenyl-phosphate 4-deoxy-4-formamido-L-arabinose transferase